MSIEPVIVSLGEGQFIAAVNGQKYKITKMQCGNWRVGMMLTWGEEVESGIYHTMKKAVKKIV